MNVVIIQPPIVQLNTPYPSGAYLQDFFNKLSKDFAKGKIDSVIWKDLSIELFHAIFCKKGLNRLFELSSEKALEMAMNAENNGDDITAFNLRRFVINASKWANWIDRIVDFLCGKANCRESLHEFVRSAHVPRGSRMENYLAGLKSDVSVDDAFMLASLSLADLADYITTVFDSNFALIRYAESLCASEADFATICSTTKAPVMKEYFAPLVQKFLASQPKIETLFCVSVPFPGTFAPALLVCEEIKKCFGKLATVVIGGGYVNTALRGLGGSALGKIAPMQETSATCEGSALGRVGERKARADSRVGGGYVNTALRGLGGSALGDYVDAICYDRGYGFYAKFFDCCVGANTLEEKYLKIEDEMTKSVFPCYDGIDFSKYPRLADDVNPMHRIWSDGAWLKAYLAHGCYWHKCLFCDTTLDYVKCYRAVNVAELYESLLKQAKQTNIFGVHFVDEAAPPLLLQEFAGQNCNNELSFWGNIRFEKAFNRDVADILAKGGLIGVSGGIEMASSEGLQDINKGIDIQNLINCLAAFKEAGVLVHAYMIYGYYNETPQMLINSAETLRQLFAAGLLDSAFWHKFTLTKHSTLFAEWEQGKHPNLKPIFPQGAFADYELHFEGEEKSNKYGRILNKALNEWSHKRSLEKPIEKWFDFPMPKPTIGKNFVNDAIEEYEKITSERFLQDLHKEVNAKNFTWLGDDLIAIPVQAKDDKKSMNFQLCWFYMGEIFYSQTWFSSLAKAKSVISDLKSLCQMQKSSKSELATMGDKNINLPKELFFELRGKGLAKKL